MRSFCSLRYATDPSPSRYNKLCGSIRSYAHRLSLLPAQDPFRTKMEAQLLSKLYDIGVLNTTAQLSEIENKLTVAAFCRRRLGVVMHRLKMAESVSAVSPKALLVALFSNARRQSNIYWLNRPAWRFSTQCTDLTALRLQAVKFIEHGHIRVGPDTITDPAYLVTR